jgi:hypothetical protein
MRTKSLLGAAAAPGAARAALLPPSPWPFFARSRHRREADGDRPTCAVDPPGDDLGHVGTWSSAGRLAVAASRR